MGLSLLQSSELLKEERKTYQPKGIFSQFLTCLGGNCLVLKIYVQFSILAFSPRLFMEQSFTLTGLSESLPASFQAEHFDPLFYLQQ